MKVVLFCGGLGMRMRDYSDSTPKPMAPIGSQPMLWHLMKYYAHYGHKEFILCLGYRGEVIKNYFLNYNQYLANDFSLHGNERRLLNNGSDIHDWSITFVDTGQHSSIGERLKAVESHLVKEDIFMANYTDGLSDLPLDTYLDFFKKHDKTASFVCVCPNHTFHVVRTDGNSIVRDISHVGESVRINGGFFIFKRSIFDYLQKGEDLVLEPFQRLIRKEELLAYHYDGFWECMDTFKDKQAFDEMYARGDLPWVVWNKE